MRLTIVILLLFFTACAPMAEIELEVIDPADFTLPVHMQQLAFINRTVGLPILGCDTSVWTQEENDILTPVIGRSIFKGVRESMVNSPLYQIDTIKILGYRQNQVDSIPVPLTSGELAFLNSIHPADGLISLENCSMRESTEDYNTQSSGYQGAYIWLETKTFWRIYDIKQGSVLDEYFLIDTLDGNYYKYMSDAQYARLSLMVIAAKAGALRTGIRYGNRISPAWITVPRYYYRSGGNEMRRAARMANENDWIAAAEIWKKLAYVEDEKTAAKACFNMALVCELEDLMIPALDWANKSSTLMPDTLTQEYISKPSANCTLISSGISSVFENHTAIV